MSPVPAGESAAGKVLPGVRGPCSADLHEVSQRATRWREILPGVWNAGPVSHNSRGAVHIARVIQPKHLAEKILTSKSALEGERKQVTVLFADLKGSMELLADRDPEEARKIRLVSQKCHGNGRAAQQ